MDQELIAAAKQARALAYARYSGYPVGAAVRGAGGVVYAGINVENQSYGLSLCAERVAIFTMVAAGERQLRALALVTKDGGNPCGACLQVMLEFVSDPGGMPVTVVALDPGTVKEFRLADLLPHGFQSEMIDRRS